MKEIRHVGIVVKDMGKALYFYRDLLGLKVVNKMVEAGSYIDKILGLKDIRVATIKLAADDGNLVELLCFNSNKKEFNLKKAICRIGISHIAFTVKNLEEECKRLTNKGVKFNAPPQCSPNGYAKVAFCKDPDGNFIELVEVLK